VRSSACYLVPEGLELRIEPSGSLVLEVSGSILLCLRRLLARRLVATGLALSSH
jgi:hypothetical protein